MDWFSAVGARLGILRFRGAGHGLRALAPLRISPKPFYRGYRQPIPGPFNLNPNPYSRPLRAEHIEPRNHLAFSMVVDKPFWQKVSDRLPEASSGLLEFKDSACLELWLRLWRSSFVFCGCCRLTRGWFWPCCLWQVSDWTSNS